MTRCFPLKSIADDMEELFPGGAWQQGWSRRSAAGTDKGAPQMPSRPRIGGGAARPAFLGGKGPTGFPSG